MASPLKTGKQSINLGAKGAPGSRIRRDPPPTEKKTLVPDRGYVDRQAVAVGIAAFALAIVILVVAFGSWAGWSPSQYTINISDSE